jgi:YfiH family protein
MFERTPEGLYESALLRQLDWVRHGFATRDSDGWPGSYTRVKQIHSSLVAVADEQEGCLGQGDALVTSVAGRWVGIRTADCVPLLIADSRRRAVAAVHGGWRGTVANIAGATVNQMVSNYDSRPEDLVAAIGPCIGECCFEVGPEVAERFRDLFPERSALRHIDLVEANRRQLMAAGVLPENIDVSAFCTFCQGAEFHSYRRDKEAAGRMVSAISIA